MGEVHCGIAHESDRRPYPEAVAILQFLLDPLNITHPLNITLISNSKNLVEFVLAPLTHYYNSILHGTVLRSLCSSSRSQLFSSQHHVKVPDSLSTNSFFPFSFVQNIDLSIVSSSTRIPHISVSIVSPPFLLFVSFVSISFVPSKLSLD